MSQTKRPEAPKFKPVHIPGLRPEIRSLATTPDDMARMYVEDKRRIGAELFIAYNERLEELRRFLNVPQLGHAPADLLILLTRVAERYAPGFEIVLQEKSSKPGPRKKAERFSIVTMVEARAAARKQNIKQAIEELAAAKINGRLLSPESLTSKYYASLKEIEARPSGTALLAVWRQDPTEHMASIMAPIFWQFESEQLGASKPTTFSP